MFVSGEATILHADAPEAELAFLHPLPVERLWGLGPAAGRHLHALAHNHDPRAVVPRRRRRSIGSQRALGRTPRTAAELDAIAVTLVDRVTGRMRGAGRIGRTVVLRLRFADFTRATRSRTLERPTAVVSNSSAAHEPTAVATASLRLRGRTLYRGPNPRAR